jgi:hypothetical protein
MLVDINQLSKIRGIRRDKGPIDKRPDLFRRR